MSRATASGRAPIEAGWSTTTSTVPCLACNFANTSRSFGSVLGRRLSNAFFLAGVTAVAWCSSLPTSRPRVDVAGLDHVRPSVVLPPAVLRHRSQHPHYEEPLDLRSRWSLPIISGLSVPPDQVTPPRSSLTRGEVMRARKPGALLRGH